MSAQDAGLAPGRVLILDGALGEELERRGYAAKLPLWSAGAVLELPSLVWEIHRDYVEAGADVLATCTFRTTRWTLAKVGMAARAEELTHQAVRLARSAASETDREVLIAGCLGPVEDCYQPELAPDDETLCAEHTHQTKMLAAVGVDLIFLETHNSLREVLIAAECALKTNLPVWASVIPKDAEHILNGDDLAELCTKLHTLGVRGTLVNCCAPDVAEAAFLTMQNAVADDERRDPDGRRSLPLLGAYPNLMEEPMTPEEFAEWAMQMVKNGASIIGGCCGSGPEHIHAIANRYRQGQARRVSRR